MFVCICFPCQRFCCHSNPRRESETVQAQGSVMGGEGVGVAKFVFFILLSVNCCSFQGVSLLILHNDGQLSVNV